MGGKPYNNNWHTDNVGFGSFSYGIGNKAKGYLSLAMGKANIASGIFSTAIGSGNTASGNHSTAMGYNTNASGSESSAMGFGTTASGSSSTAMGLSTTSSGENSTAMGESTIASGASSTAIGLATTSSGENSTAMGKSTKANGYSSLVAGMHNDSLVAAQTAVNTTTPLFIVGNGNSNADRSNALVVLKNGNVAIGDNGNPVNRLHITGGTSANLSSSTGYITTGFITSTNMAIDNNGLQVRSNGVASDLYVQNSGGNVSIGNTGVPAFQLEITGTAGKPGGSSWSNASDRRLKENILPYSDGLQQLLKIKPVKYHYNAASGYDTKPEYVGIIAQDLQTVAPYMVSTLKKEDKEYLSVDNSAMTYMLINAVKEQQQQIEALKAEIELLKKGNK